MKKSNLIVLFILLVGLAFTPNSIYARTQLGSAIASNSDLLAKAAAEFEVFPEEIQDLLHQQLQQLDATQLEELLTKNTQSSIEGVQVSTTSCFISIPSHGVNAPEIGMLNGKPHYYQFSSGFFDTEIDIFWDNNAWRYIVSFVNINFGFDRINYDDTPTPPCSGEWLDITRPDNPFPVMLVLEGCCSSGCDDADGDGICLEDDNCPDTYNPDQIDSDQDGIGDDCDICPFDADNDLDGDGICGDVDACPNDADNDIDGDGVCGDVDNCPTDANTDQGDLDADGIGDACDAALDFCAAVEVLEAYIESLNLPNNTANFLLNKLNSALGKFEQGNTNAANGMLGAFMNKVNAKTPSQISPSENAFLIAAAQLIIDAINNGTAVCDENTQGLVINHPNNYSNALARTELEVFPNPANDILNIQLRGLETAATISIYDSVGKLIWSQEQDATDATLTIDLDSQFSKGIYLVHVISGEQKLTKRVAVIK